MNILRDFDERAHRLGIVNLKLTQAASFFFALILAKTFPVILGPSVWWFVGLTLLVAIGPSIRFFAPRKRQDS